jgi:signal transduction histidine kinase
VNVPSPFRRLRTKLLLSYVLVIAAGIGGLALGVQLVGPSLFDRMLTRHMDHGPGMMAGGMSEAMRQSTVDAFRDSIFQALLISTVVASIVAVVISLFVANRITVPLRRLAAGVHRIASGGYETRVPVTENDEIGDLAAAFNSMAGALEDAESRRVRLVGDVAHELRTPLSTLRGNLEGLLDGVVEPEPRLWELLLSETERLGRIINDLQGLSRVESGVVSFDVGPVTPEHVVNATLERMTPRFAEQGIALHREMTTGLPMVAVDQDRAIQALSNVLTNALRYTAPGGIVTVSADLEGEMVVIRVRDTGIGIPEEDLPRIFDRFYRVDKARSRALGGSGIGLTIARVLVEGQGGRIWAESPGPGKGSTFSIALPVADRLLVHGNP